MSRDHNIERITEQAISALMEHADSVRVFVTYRDGGEGITRAYTEGGGNYYAQYGQISEWVVNRDENTDSEKSHD